MRALTSLLFGIIVKLTVAATNPFLPEPPFPNVGFRQTSVPINFERRGVSASSGITELPVDLWYPSTNDPAVTLETAAIRLKFLLATLDIPIVQTFGPTVESVFQDAPLASSEQPFPVVIFSHGALGISFQNVYLYNALAQFGFVVAAIDHLGNSAFDPTRFVFQGQDGMEDVLFNREGDVFAVLDYIESFFPVGTVNTLQSAIIGHSLGTMTAVQASLRDDPRIKGILALAPAFLEEVKNLKLPAFFMTGDQDLILPASVHAKPILDALRARENPPLATFLIDFLGAGHNSFTDLCFWQSSLEDLTNNLSVPFAVRSVISLLLPILDQQADRPCKDSNILDFDTVNDLVAMYAVAFLKAIFGDDNITTTSDSSVVEFEGYLESTFATANSFPLVFEDTSSTVLSDSITASDNNDQPTGTSTSLTRNQRKRRRRQQRNGCRRNNARRLNQGRRRRKRNRNRGNLRCQDGTRVSS